MTAPVKQLNRGGIAAAEQQAAEKAARKSQGFQDWTYLKLKGPEAGATSPWGESIVLRLVTDEHEWVAGRQHNFIPTKPAPKDKPEGKGWPAKLGALCRYTKAGDDTLYDDCYICDEIKVPDNKDPKKMVKPWAAPRLWAIAAVREEVIGTREMFEQGLIEEYEIDSPVGYIDAEYDKEIWENGEKTGRVERRKKFVVLNYGSKNFFDKLIGYFQVHRTVLDVDFKVTRKNGDATTDYDVVPLDPITTEIDGKVVKYDLRNPKIRALYDVPLDLNEEVQRQATDEWYEWYFDPRVESSWAERYPARDAGSSDQSDDSTPAEVTKAADDPVAEEDRRKTLDAVRARMRAKSTTASN